MHCMTHYLSEKFVAMNPFFLSPRKQKWKPQCLLSMMLLVFFLNANAQQTIVQYLSGTDKDHTVQWDFRCTKGRNSGVWSTIPVPSCWEMQGYGTYSY
jgi:hypothetical protein